MKTAVLAVLVLFLCSGCINSIRHDIAPVNYVPGSMKILGPADQTVTTFFLFGLLNWEVKITPESLIGDFPLGPMVIDVEAMAKNQYHTKADNDKVILNPSVETDFNYFWLPLLGYSRTVRVSGIVAQIIRN